MTNVLEGGALPLHAPESWQSFGGRIYNTYRSQPRSYGVAPDLRVVAVSVSSPDAECGSLTDNIDIGFEIENGGDLRVGPGVRVAFIGTYGNDEEPLLDEQRRSARGRAAAEPRAGQEHPALGALRAGEQRAQWAARRGARGGRPEVGRAPRRRRARVPRGQQQPRRAGRAGQRARGPAPRARPRHRGLPDRRGRDPLAERRHRGHRQHARALLRGRPEPGRQRAATSSASRARSRRARRRPSPR